MNSSDERRLRREAFFRLAAEDLVAIEQQTIEYMSLKTDNPMTGEQIRTSLYRIHDVFGISSFPRGYRILGGTKATPRYIKRGDSSEYRATDSDLVADALTGWLQEITEFLETRLQPLRNQKRPVTSDATEADNETTL